MLYQACECELGCNCDELATIRWQVFLSLRLPDSPLNQC
ncbi:hypothetical protein COLO4_05396 [Corchorus olitorius]|uniref:Uncharacterized protein n=1 Tax=Corchorus olitorius TaxID=93759 RepID=A0A1R3KR26_9ROSI|nr:hypothetical protein COLO4_05396 [Corchorus olitorius]